MVGVSGVISQVRGAVYAARGRRVILFATKNFPFGCRSVKPDGSKFQTRMLKWLEEKAFEILIDIQTSSRHIRTPYAQTHR